MKGLLSLAIVATALGSSLFISNCSAGEAKEDLEWKRFEQALAEAEKSDKKVLIDVYTDWCGWCKKMDAGTYADPGVASYISKNYVAVKLDAESNAKLMYRGKRYSEREFASEFGVSGYPSTIFLTSKGAPITIYPGFADAAKFKKVLTFIGEDYYLTMRFDEYVAGRE